VSQSGKPGLGRLRQELKSLIEQLRA